MSNNEDAYEIKITPIISNETFNRVKKVEAIQTKTIVFFRYVCATLYRDYDVINDEKFFLDEDEAIAYWNEAISSNFSMFIPQNFMKATA